MRNEVDVMSAIGEAKLCLLTSGRRKGDEVRVIKMLDSGFVLVKMKNDKERKVAVTHLEPKTKG